MPLAHTVSVAACTLAVTGMLATLPQRRLKLREFAQALGVDLQKNPMQA